MGETSFQKASKKAINITIYDVSAELVKEFNEYVVKPLCFSDISSAIKNLMESVIEKRKQKKATTIKRCPECEGEMEHGYISHFDALRWRTEEGGLGEIISGPGWFRAKKKWGYICRNCRILLLYYDENWG